MAWKVVVDFDVCESNAICMGVAPEVFEVRDDDFLYVLQEEPPDELRPMRFIQRITSVKCLPQRFDIPRGSQGEPPKEQRHVGFRLLQDLKQIAHQCVVARPVEAR